MFDKESVATFKDRLIRDQQELLDLEGIGNTGAKIVELDQTRVGRLSRMDALQGQAMSLEAKERRQIQLEKIAAALRRIERGEYGYCIGCDEAINVKRLEFDPAAPLCITCASNAEQTRR